MAEEGESHDSNGEEKKKPGMLESAISECGDLLKIGLATAIPAAQALLINPFTYARDTAILTGAQILGNKTTAIKRGEKYTATNTLESAVLGTAITIPSYHLFESMSHLPLNNALDYAVKGAVWGGVAYPAFFGMYQTMDYLIKNRTFKGLPKYLKENYWTALKTAWKTILPFSLINIFFVPPFLQIPIAAALSYAVTLFGAPKKGEIPDDRKKDTTPYSTALMNVTKKGTGLLAEPFYAVGRITDALGEWYKSSPKAEPESAH